MIYFVDLVESLFYLEKMLLFQSVEAGSTTNHQSFVLIGWPGFIHHGMCMKCSSIE